MRSNRHLHAVDLPSFSITAKEIQEAREAAREKQERALYRMLIKARHLEITRVILDVLVLGCGVLILCALSK